MLSRIWGTSQTPATAYRLPLYHSMDVIVISFGQSNFFHFESERQYKTPFPPAIYISDLDIHFTHKNDALGSGESTSVHSFPS